MSARSRWAVSVVAIVALLFAPATDEVPPSIAHAGAPDDPRILAPTVRDGVVGLRPKLAMPDPGATDHGAPARPGLLGVTWAGVVGLLVWVWLAIGLRSANGPILLRGLVPRGPPRIQPA